MPTTGTSSTATSAGTAAAAAAAAESLPIPPSRRVGGGDYDHPSTRSMSMREMDGKFPRSVGRLNPLASPPVRGGHGGRRRDDVASSSYSCGCLGDAAEEGSDGASRKKVRHRAVRVATSISPPGPDLTRRPATILLGLSAGTCLCLLVATAWAIRGPDGAGEHVLHRSEFGEGSMIPSTTSIAWIVHGYAQREDEERRHLRRRLFREVRSAGDGVDAGIDGAGLDVDDAYRERPERPQQRPKQRFSPPRTSAEESGEEFVSSTTTATTTNDGDDGAIMQPPSLLPLSSGDLWGLALAVVGLMLAAGGGVGGGGILVPIYTLVLRFSPRHAIPLSNVTVFGGAVANAMLNSRKRHPSADRPLVDWDLMLVMEPLTISGALIGSFVNKLLPETVLVVALVLLLGFTAYNTLRKAKRMHDKESEDWRALAGMEMEEEAEAECELRAAIVDDGDDFHPERPPHRDEGKEQDDYLSSNNNNVRGTLGTQTIGSDIKEADDEIYNQQMIVDDECMYDEIEDELEALADRLREGLVEEEKLGEKMEPVDAPPRPSTLPPPKNCKGFKPLPVLRRRSSSTVVVAVSPTEHRQEHEQSNCGTAGSGGPIRAGSVPLECREQRGEEDNSRIPADYSCPASFRRQRTVTPSSEEEKKDSHTPSGCSPSPITVHFKVSSLPPSKRKAYEERCRTPQLGDVELVDVVYARDEYRVDARAREVEEEVRGDDCEGARSQRVLHGPGTGLWGRRYEPIAAKTTTSSCGIDAEHDNSAAVLDGIVEEERYSPPRNVCTLSGMFLVVVIVNVLKGGGAFSPLGVECGSAQFWIAEIFLNVWVLSVFAVARSYLVRRAELKRRVGYRYVEGDIEWTPRATVVYPAICCLAGFFAGMFGIGGGIVKGPLMLAMGVHPAVASATSACMILFTSLAATTSYGVFGLLVPDYAAACLGIGFLATLLGQAVMSGLLRRHGRSSYIAFSIGIVVLLSAVCMTAESVVSIMLGREGGAGGGHDDGGLCSRVE